MFRPRFDLTQPEHIRTGRFVSRIAPSHASEGDGPRIAEKPGNPAANSYFFVKQP
jgi:hypothetical protein